ncbi:MAG: hypothetical protein K6F11_02260 [Lachnospiraceae bacterium]|nr:hypothetical protein [Lachnospiraceae bacterium]
MEKENMMINDGTEVTTYAPVRVKAKSKYIMIPKKSYAGDIWGVLISVLLIFGGLSGQFVLRGTQSSTALVVAGFVFLIIDIIGILNKSKKLNEHGARVRKMHMAEDEVLRNSKQLETDIPVKICYDKSQSILAFNPAVNGVSMKKNTKGYCFEGTTNRRRSILNFEALDLVVVFDIKDNSEIVFTLENNKNEFTLVVPSTVTFVTDSVQTSQPF